MDELCALEMADIGGRWVEAGNPALGDFVGPYGVPVTTKDLSRDTPKTNAARYSETLKVCGAFFPNKEEARHCADNTFGIEEAIRKGEITEAEGKKILEVEFVPGTLGPKRFDEALPGETLRDLVADNEWYDRELQPGLDRQLRRTGQLPPLQQSWMPWITVGGLGLILLVAVAGRR